MLAQPNRGMATTGGEKIRPLSKSGQPIRLTISSPHKTLLHQTKVSQVTFPSFEGYIGFTSKGEGQKMNWNEFDNVAKIEPGVITAKIIGEDGIEKSQMYKVNGGFAFFYEDECSLTVPDVQPLLPEETALIPPGSPKSIPARQDTFLTVM